MNFDDINISHELLITQGLFGNRTAIKKLESTLKKYDFSMKTTLKEIAAYFDYTDTFKAKFDIAYDLAAEKKLCIQGAITNIKWLFEPTEPGRYHHKGTDAHDMGLKTLETDILAYHSFIRGYDLSIYELYHLFEAKPDWDDYEKNIESTLSHLGEATAYATLMLDLKDLYELQTEIEKYGVESNIKYKNQAQQVAWLHALGILDFILKQVPKNGGYNYTMAAKIIASFTNGLNIETLRKDMEAIFKTPSKSNNPHNNPDNIEFVNELKRQFKISN